MKHELIRLAREYAIATPFTSLLIVPEAAPGAEARRHAQALEDDAPLASCSPIPSGGGGFGGAWGAAVRAWA